MRIAASTLCVTDGTTKGGVLATHILSSVLDRKTDMLGGVPAPSGSVAFLELPLEQYPEEKYPNKTVRVLHKDAQEGTHSWHDRKRIESEHPWVSAAAIIVCIRPMRKDADHKRYYETLTRCLRELCCLVPRAQPASGPLSRDEKKLLRIRARQAELRESVGTAITL